MCKDVRENKSTAFSIPGPWIWLSLVVSALVTFSSLLGIFVQKTYAHETNAWAIQAVGQDCANLVAVVVLVASAYLTARRSVKAFFVGLGVHLYFVYAFAIYSFALHFQFLFLVYVAILGLSFYSFLGGLVAASSGAAAKMVSWNANTKAPSIFLLVIAIMFALLWLSEIVPHLLAGTVPRSLVESGLWVNPVHVLDLAFVLPGMIIVSVLLRRKREMGYILAVSLLVFAALMGMAILFLFGLYALRGMPYSLPAVVAIGLIVLLSGHFSRLLLMGPGQ